MFLLKSSVDVMVQYFLQLNLKIQEPMDSIQHMQRTNNNVITT